MSKKTRLTCDNAVLELNPISLHLQRQFGVENFGRKEDEDPDMSSQARFSVLRLLNVRSVRAEEPVAHQSLTQKCFQRLSPNELRLSIFDAIEKRAASRELQCDRTI